MPFNKLKKYKLLQNKLLQNKKYTFPIFVLILFLTFGFFYYFNFLSTRNDEATLQATVGSAKLDDFTATKFFGVQGIAGFNASPQAVVWNVTGNEELKDCAFFARRSKVIPVKVTLNNQQYNIRVYDNVEIRDMKNSRSGVYAVVTGIDSKSLKQEKILPNNCGLVIIKKDGDGPINVNQYIGGSNGTKKFSYKVIFDGKETEIGADVSNQEFEEISRLLNQQESEIKNLSSIQNTSSSNKKIPSEIRVPFSIRSWKFELVFYTKNLTYSVVTISKPKDKTPQQLQVELQQMQNSFEMLRAITESVKKAADNLNKYKIKG